MTVALAMDRLALDAISGFITLLGLVVATIPVITWLARKEDDPRLVRVLTLGLAFTVGGSLVRYFVITVLYGDNADAGVYSDAATEMVRLIKAGVFTLVPPGLEGRPPESQRIAVVLAAVYVVVGVSRWAGTFVFAWLAFGGRILLWRALKRAVPEADQHRYLLLVLFFPSLAFWPSSIGKEALMTFSIGLVSYGAAQLFSERVSLGSVFTFGAGVVALLFVRPHMAAIAVAALGLEQGRWFCWLASLWWCSPRHRSFSGTRRLARAPASTPVRPRGWRASSRAPRRKPASGVRYSTLRPSTHPSTSHGRPSRCCSVLSLGKHRAAPASSLRWKGLDCWSCSPPVGAGWHRGS